MANKRKSDVIEISDEEGEEDQTIPKAKRAAFTKAFSMFEMIFDTYQRMEKKDSSQESMARCMTMQFKDITLNNPSADGIFPDSNGLFDAFNENVHSKEDAEREPEIYRGLVKFYHQGKVEIVLYPLGFPDEFKEGDEELEKLRNRQRYFFPSDAKPGQEYSYFVDFQDWILTPTSGTVSLHSNESDESF